MQSKENLALRQVVLSDQLNRLFGQGLGLKPFTSRHTTVLKEEIKECDRAISNLISSSNSKVQDLVKEIKKLTQQTSQESYVSYFQG